MSNLLSSQGTIEEIYDKFKNIWSKKEFEENIEQLKNKMILKTEENDEKIYENYTNYNYKSNNINSIVLLVSQECNLRCTYCYGKNGEYNNKGVMSLSTGKNAIKFLYENSTLHKEIHISFFGGEPLLDFDKIQKLVSYAKDLEKQYDKKINFSITTNGTLLSDEITNFLIKNKFSVTLSIDGDKNTNDYNRFFPNKLGAYKTTVENSKNLRENLKVTARSTITENGLDLVHNFKHLYALGFGNVYMSPSVNMLDDKDYDVLIENYKKLIDLFVYDLKNNDTKRLSRMGNVYHLFKIINDGGIRHKNCGATNNMYAIDISGNIYPCHRFVGIEEWKIGNIDTGINKALYEKALNEMLLKESNSCSHCWMANICGGGCPQENLVMTNTINEPYGNNCRFMKSIIEYAIYKYLDFSEKEKDYLFRKNKKLKAN